MAPPAQPRFQVHLDFHTSRDCTDVGAAFDPEAFARTVREAGVRSMTVFAKCHHGFAYYPTRAGTQHPHLGFDLLGAQVAALHAEGVRAPIYVSVQWDDLAGEEHPEWVCANADGTLLARPPLGADSPLDGRQGWTTVDVGSGYGDYLLAHVEELLDGYPCDGFFFDICVPVGNWSPWGRRRMTEAGVALDEPEAVRAFAADELDRFEGRVSALVRERAPDATLFYNGSVHARMGAAVRHQTHLEIESLPTSQGIWGYLHYPTVARQARTNGVDILGMTGRFHKAWADFGGLKTRDQLEYECGTIVAAGGAISVGDQLHPRGELDPAVYRLLRDAFHRVEALEPWLDGARPLAEVAIVSATRPLAQGSLVVPGQALDVEGAAQLLLELGVQFDIVEPGVGSLEGYEVVVVPEGVELDEGLLAALAAHRAAGGRLVLSGTAGLGEDGEWLLPDVPARYLGPAPTVPSYLRPDEALAEGSELASDYDYAFYGQAHRVAPLPGATGRGTLSRALFTRTWEHFTSHAQAPVGDALDAPVLVEGDGVLYLAAPLLAAYREHDYWAYRALLAAALRPLLPARLVELEGPGWAETTVHEQPGADGAPARRVVHVVAYHPRRTAQPIAHVDQGARVAGLAVRVLTPDGCRRAYLAPGEEELSFAREGEHTRVELPPVGTHAVLVLES